MSHRQTPNDRKTESRLTQPLALEDGRPPRILSMTLYSLSAFVIAGVAWASVAEIREITIAPGQIVPMGQVHVVQHLEGGIVAEILARDGSVVSAGQPLVRLEPVQAEADAAQMRSRQASLKMQIMRLDALARGAEPDFGALARSAPTIAHEQIAQFHAEVAQRRREHDTLTARLNQRLSEARAFVAQEKSLAEQVAIHREQFKLQENLLRQGYTARRTYLDVQAQFQRSQSELIEVRGRLATSREAEQEARNQIAEAAANAARKIADERAKAASDLSEVESQIAKLADRVERLVVRAPSAGVVQEMSPKALGEVVRPGDVVARVVPQGFELVAEVRVDPKDIGHIRPGSLADVKFSTFDPALFGSARGTVERISATTFAPQPGQPMPGFQPGSQEPFYRATVRLNEPYIGVGGLRRPIAPGMVVSAEIITGYKSITRYMLKPVFRSVDQAFTER